MIAFYPEIRSVHLLAVALSVVLFAGRGALALAGRPLAHHPLLRWGAITVDTVLLTAALMLATVLQQYPFVHGWLTVKVLLLAAYVALGHRALRGRCEPRARLGWLLAALAVFALIVSVARAHHPLGLLRLLLG